MQIQHRTYLWLYLSMDKIRKTYQSSLYPNIVVIKSLPQSIEEAYERLLQRIDRKYWSNARQVLLIIVGARRPLTVREMAYALDSADQNVHTRKTCYFDQFDDMIPCRIFVSLNTFHSSLKLVSVDH